MFSAASIITEKTVTAPKPNMVYNARRGLLSAVMAMYLTSPTLRPINKTGCMKLTARLARVNSPKPEGPKLAQPP